MNKHTNKDKQKQKNINEHKNKTIHNKQKPKETYIESKT